MATIVQKFQLDRTGINPDNLIEDEIHDNVDLNTGIVIPEFKNFFTESLIVKNVDDDILERNVDYIPIEFNQEASLMVGKEICTAIVLITNLDKLPISLTYQVLGGSDTYSSSNLIEAYIEKVPPFAPVHWDDITDKPREFSPVAHHLHDADEIYGLEYIVSGLNRIENAIRVGSYTTFRELLAFIDTSLIQIQIDMEAYLDANMPDKLEDFKSIFTKEYIGLDKIANLKYALEKEGLALGSPSFTASQIVENKYILIETLIGFKRAIYQNLIRRDLTGLDLAIGKFGTPSSYSLRDTGNRSTYNTISRNQAVDTQTDFSENFYPDGFSYSNETVVMKLSNGVEDNDCDLILIDQTSLETYWGTLVEEIQGIDLTWKKFTTNIKLAQLSATLQAHINDKGNPHELTKEQIQMEKVENLPVVTQAELDGPMSVRSYITFDTLLYFARVHFLQNGPDSPSTPESRNKFIIDNAVVVYSPAGKSTEVVYSPSVSGLDGNFPIGSNVGWAVNNGEPRSKFTMRTQLGANTPVTREYTLDAYGAYMGNMAVGVQEGVIQSIFTFKGNKLSIHNTVVYKPEEAPIPPPPPPPPPVYYPSINISASRLAVIPGIASIVTINVSGAAPGNFAVEFSYKYLSGSHKVLKSKTTIGIGGNGTGSGSVIAGDPSGSYQQFGRITINNGLPAGNWQGTVTGGGTTSNSIIITHQLPSGGVYIKSK